MTGGKKRVLVTRAARQGSELAEHLRALGANPVLVPAIETMEPTSLDPLNGALSHLDRFDWLLFTSANAVEALACHIGNRPLRFAGKVAAIGPATARALHPLGLSADLIPTQAVAESLTEALLDHARQADGAATRFLLLRAEEAREQLPTALRAAGAEVVIVPAYRTVIPESSKTLVQRLFRDGAEAPIEAVTFTSSSTARNFLALCDMSGVTPPHGAKRVSIGPITSQTLAELGFPADAEAREATVASLAEAVMEVLERSDRPS